MFCQVFVAVLVLGMTAAAPGDYGGPVYSSPLPYNFQYGVYDHYKGANYGQHENSDGKAVYGSYYVDLPDGRKQRVDYTAHPYTGYIAKVSYYGKAQHPKHYGPPATFFKHHGHGYGYGH